MIKSNLEEGNKAFREGRLNDALGYYKIAIETKPELKKITNFNIELVHKRLHSETINRKRNLITVPIEKRTRMILVAMIRNEGPGVNQWLTHVLSLFDEIHLVDHDSSDGTRELLTAISRIRPNVKLYLYDQPEYLQSLIMTHIAKKELKANGDDWVFLLDADEFLPFYSNDEFHSAMGEYRNQNIIKLPWINLVPENYDDDDYFGKAYLKPNIESGISKIAFRINAIKDLEFNIEQGNHNLIINNERAYAYGAFNLLHIPVRSRDQFKKKIQTGVLAYRAMDEYGDSIGFHWFEIEKYIESKKICDDDLNGIVQGYSGKDQKINPISKTKLLEIGYSSFTLNISNQTKERFAIDTLNFIYSKSNMEKTLSANVYALKINTANKEIIINPINKKQQILQEDQKIDVLANKRIVDREYKIPSNNFEYSALDSSAMLCKKELQPFLGSRSFSTGTYIVDYLDVPPLHTFYVADLLRNCRIIRFCRSAEEVKFIRSMCVINSIDNLVALEPDFYHSELLDKTCALADQLPIQNKDNKSKDLDGILLLGSVTREDIDAPLKKLFENTNLSVSIFHEETSQVKSTWKISKPSNVYFFGSAPAFRRSDFATGQYSSRTPGLDIVVAMYNTPKYIAECVDSLISIDRDDVNVIIVNDGSTDNSLEVVKDRYSNHPRVRVITKINGGCASARNFGRLHSTSSHIAFVDSDDFTDQNMFANLYDCALYTGAEVTQGGFDFYHEGAEQQFISSYEDSLFASYHRQEFQGHQIIRVNSSDLICGQPTIWRRVYRRDFLDAKRIHFPENVRAYDDYIFHTLSIYYARDVFMIPDIKMHYRQHDGQDIKQGDERHFYEIYMFKQLLRRSLEEGWPDFVTFLPSIINSIHWSLQTLRNDLITPFAHASANFICCVEKVYGSSVTAKIDLSAIKVSQFHEELSRMRVDNQYWDQSYVWAYIESIDNHPITLTMQNSVK